MGGSNPTAFEKGSVGLVKSILLVWSANGNFYVFLRISRMLSTKNNSVTKKILTKKNLISDLSSIVTECELIYMEVGTRHICNHTATVLHKNLYKWRIRGAKLWAVLSKKEKYMNENNFFLLLCVYFIFSFRFYPLSCFKNFFDM